MRERDHPAVPNAQMGRRGHPHPPGLELGVPGEVGEALPAHAHRVRGQAPHLEVAQARLHRAALGRRDRPMRCASAHVRSDGNGRGLVAVKVGVTVLVPGLPAAGSPARTASAPSKVAPSGRARASSRLCAAIVARLTFGGNIIGTGTASYRLAHARAQRAGQPAKR